MLVTHSNAIKKENVFICLVLPRFKAKDPATIYPNNRIVFAPNHP